MNKVTVKEFYNTLAKGHSAMIGHNHIDKNNEEEFEKVLKDYATNNVSQALEKVTFTSYELKSFGAVSKEGSELRHNKDSEYFSLGDNLIIAKVNWKHCTLYLTYLVN